MKKRTRATYTPEFRLEAAKLVTEHHYTVREAAEAMNVSKSSIDLWVGQLRKRDKGLPAKGAALTPEQVEIKALKKKLARVELEAEILKKATALLMSDSLDDVS